MYVCFFKQKTAYELLISDWSSDVCASDLEVIAGPIPPGSVRDSHGLQVVQSDPQHVEITYADSRVTISAAPGDVYAISIGPPNQGPPQPPQRSEERRVGTEWGRTCRSRGGQETEKKKEIRVKNHNA